MANGEHMSGMLTVREVARLFHIHPNTLRRWSNAGRIKAYQINQVLDALREEELI